MASNQPPRKIQVLDRITDEMIIEAVRKPRLMPPYFEHEPLDPNLYAGEWAQPCVQISITGILPYDIEKAFTEERGVEDVEDEYDDDDDEEEIERIFNSMLAQSGDQAVSEPKPGSTEAPPQSTSDADRIVVGPRPVEGKGKKLCGLDDMDDDDKLIYYLKLAKWSERAIHDKLVAEGRIGYNKKTIGTRFARMRRFIMAETDKRLKDGTTVWLDAEKKLLPAAVSQANQQIEKERQALRQRKWQLVSDFIQKHEPLALYSGEACREQYEKTLQDDPNVASWSDPKVSKLRKEREEQTALLEHYKRSEIL